MSSSSSTSGPDKGVVIDPSVWKRAGRGRELQFFASDSDVAHWFSRLPSRFASCVMCHTQLIKEGSSFVSAFRIITLEDWLHSIEAHDTVVSRQCYLMWPEVASAAVRDKNMQNRIDEWAGINGLLILQHGASRKGQRLASRVAIVDKVKHIQNGRTDVLSHSVELFGYIKGKIQQDLKYTSVQVFRDGHSEESNLQLMTDAAAQEARAGMFTRLPGREYRSGEEGVSG